MIENGAIYVEGLDELLRKMDNLPAEVQRKCFKAMQSASLDIIADAKGNLRVNGSVVTGNLRASGKVQKVDDKTLDVGFFSSDSDKGYARYVEFGRKPDELPPLDILADDLEPWAYKKFRLSHKEARSMAWAVAHSISKKGTKARPYFEPAVESGWRKMIDKIAKIVKI